MEHYKFDVQLRYQNTAFHLALERVNHIVGIVGEWILNLNVPECKNVSIGTMYSIHSNLR